MRKLYHAFSERVGEVEGIFDKFGSLLGFWCCNDAVWRNEYFEPFMQKLGFEIEPAPDWMVEKLEETACKAWGIEIEE